MEDTLEAFHDDDVASRLPCPVCQRRFNEDVLIRHVSICEKSAKKKRKPFNSQKQRLDGSEVNADSIKKESVQKQSRTPKKNNWRAKHEAFVASIRAARGCPTEKDTSGVTTAGPTTSTINPDYIQCPCCKRRFNEHSATRHIEFCREQKSRVVSNKAGAQDVTKLAKRTQYKPPLPGKKKSLDSQSARQTSSPKHGNNSYLPSSAEKDTSSVKRQSVVRRTQSSNVTDDRKQLVFKRRSGSLNSNNDRLTDDLHSPKHSATNGVTSRQNKPQDIDFFQDEDISRAASGKRRNRRTQPPIASPSKVFNDGQTATPPGVPKKSEHTFHHELEDAGSGSGDDPGSFRTIESGRRKGSRHNSPSNVSRTESGISVGSGSTRTGSATKLSKFCYECGTKYPVAHAKYCCECGVKRLHIDI